MARCGRAAAALQGGAVHTGFSRGLWDRVSQVSSAFISDLKGPGTTVSLPLPFISLLGSFTHRQISTSLVFSRAGLTHMSSCGPCGWACRGPGHPGMEGDFMSMRGYQTVSFDCAHSCRGSEFREGVVGPSGLCAPCCPGPQLGRLGGWRRCRLSAGTPAGLLHHPRPREAGPAAPAAQGSRGMCPGCQGGSYVTL